MKEFDITTKVYDLSFASDDFVIVGIPVYCGRVLAVAKERYTGVDNYEGLSLYKIRFYSMMINNK